MWCGPYSILVVDAIWMEILFFTSSIFCQNKQPHMNFTQLNVSRKKEKTASDINPRCFFSTNLIHISSFKCLMMVGYL